MSYRTTTFTTFPAAIHTFFFFPHGTMEELREENVAAFAL